MRAAILPLALTGCAATQPAHAGVIMAAIVVAAVATVVAMRVRQPSDAYAARVNRAADRDDGFDLAGHMTPDVRTRFDGECDGTRTDCCMVAQEIADAEREGDISISEHRRGRAGGAVHGERND